MVMHRVIYETKDTRNNLIQNIRIFSDMAAACTFLRVIKHQSVTKPILDQINNRKGK